MTVSPDRSMCFPWAQCRSGTPRRSVFRQGLSTQHHAKKITTDHREFKNSRSSSSNTVTNGIKEKNWKRRTALHLSFSSLVQHMWGSNYLGLPFLPDFCSLVSAYSLLRSPSFNMLIWLTVEVHSSASWAHVRHQSNSAWMWENGWSQMTSCHSISKPCLVSVNISRLESARVSPAFAPLFVYLVLSHQHDTQKSWPQNIWKKRND